MTTSKLTRQFACFKKYGFSNSFPDELSVEQRAADAL